MRGVAEGGGGGWGGWGGVEGVGEGGGGVGGWGWGWGVGVGEGGAVPACLICGKLVAVFHLCSMTYTSKYVLSLSPGFGSHVSGRHFNTGKKVRFSQRGFNSKRGPLSSPFFTPPPSFGSNTSLLQNMSDVDKMENFTEESSNLSRAAGTV